MLWAGCQRERPEPSGADEVAFSVTYSRNLSVAASSVNPVDRILVLPFRKINDALPDNDRSNFIPDYAHAFQWDVTSFPTGTKFLELQPEARYKVLVIGYKSTDYDFSGEAVTPATFSLGADDVPENLENFRIRLNDLGQIPELFLSKCQAYADGVPQGEVFTVTPGQMIRLTAELNRIVSGLSVEISDVPDFVDSVTLSAGMVTRALLLDDTIPSVVDDSAAVGSVVQLLQKAPEAGSLLMNTFLLPVTSADTWLYLDIKYGTNRERYTVKVNDSEVSENNKILFLANRQVVITGSYNTIDIGFILTYYIDLDDNIWDGIDGGPGVRPTNPINLDDDAWDGIDGRDSDIRPTNPINLDDNTWDGIKTN